jgi:deoxyribodipyrimidine photo-lyase
MRLWDDHIIPLAERPVCRPADGLGSPSDIDLSDVPRALSRLDVDRSVAPVRRFTGGASAARARFAAFLDDHLAGYGKNRKVPEAGAGSHMSPYLHFGQISPVELAL